MKQSTPDPAADPASPTLVATLTEAAELESCPPELLRRVGLIELRADLVGDLDPAWLAEHWEGPVLYTLRSRVEGGRGEPRSEDRASRLIAAAERFELIDLEAERDLTPELLRAIPAERRVLSWHGGVGELDELRRTVERMDEAGGRHLKLAPSATRSGQELAPLDLVAELGRTDVTAFATGEIGAWTRLVAAALGAPLLFGSLGERPAAPGQPSLRRLALDYELPRPLRPVPLFGIVGRPVSHSLSPRLHNRAYRRLGVDALYLAFHAEQFGDFWLEVVEDDRFERWGMPLVGLSVTSPFKETALAVAGASSPRAQAIGGANTMVRRRGVWEAESTDPEGVLEPLRRRGVELAGARAAVVGCGGAGRAAAVGLDRARARVTLFNRSENRGRRAAQELDLELGSLAAFDPSEFDVVVHATSLGHHPSDPLPFDPTALRPQAILVDMVYDHHETPLVTVARAAGRATVGGREVLLCQAIGQFRAMTGEELPWDLAVDALGLDPRAVGGAPAPGGSS
ncbi:MAG TPA: type I 3-dehydroquinate dehydratase [Thermoanaerobaculia bacterium]|nr:type I 3-dehydroquinate dehydratase [Thermoanaerobaculia bacterium]